MSKIKQFFAVVATLLRIIADRLHPDPDHLELYRWRLNCQEARRWLSHHGKIAATLDWLEGRAKGSPDHISVFRIRAGLEPLRPVRTKLIVPVHYVYTPKSSDNGHAVGDDTDNTTPPGAFTQGG